MSYKKKKIKKNIMNQLKRRIGLIQIVLFKKINKLFIQKLKKEEPMQMQTRTIMAWLRSRAKMIRTNNKLINDWVGEYIEECVLQGKPVEVLVQFCISKDLEIRYEKQGKQFIPTKAEEQVFLKDIPLILNIFQEEGIRMSWWITLNRSYLDGGRIDQKLEIEYRKMIQSLIDESGVSDVLLLDWEDEILNGRPEANRNVQQNISSYVSRDAFQIDLERHMSWVRNDTTMVQTDQEIENDLRFKIACEAEEGKFLINDTSPFSGGKFILVPLEVPERYVFFEILAPDFNKRIVPILRPYPWRIEKD